MNVSSINFQGRASYERFTTVKDATPAQIVAVIDKAHKEAGMEPLRPLSVKRFLYVNRGCIDNKTGRLNEKGLKGFNEINKDLGVTENSRLYELGTAIRDYLAQYAKYNDGEATRIFDYII